MICDTSHTINTYITLQLEYQLMGGLILMNLDFNNNPFIVIWELTRACQLKCLHCRAEAQYHRHPLELTFEEGKKLIDDIYEMENPMLVFTGGDPLMRPDVYDIAEYAVKKRCSSIYDTKCHPERYERNDSKSKRSRTC